MFHTCAEKVEQMTLAKQEPESRFGNGYRTSTMSKEKETLPISSAGKTWNSPLLTRHHRQARTRETKLVYK